MRRRESSAQRCDLQHVTAGQSQNSILVTESESSRQESYGNRNNQSRRQQLTRWHHRTQKNRSPSLRHVAGESSNLLMIESHGPSLPRHGSLGVLPPHLRRLLVRRPDHHPFLNQLDHVLGVHLIQEKKFVRFARRENFRARSPHLARVSPDPQRHT